MTISTAKSRTRTVLCATAIAALALSGCTGQQGTTETSAATTTTTRSVNLPAPSLPDSGPAGLTGWPGQDKITEEAMAALFTDEEIARALDTDVAKTNKRDKPFTATDSDDASCNVTQGLTVESVGKDYETFRGTEMLLGDAKTRTHRCIKPSRHTATRTRRRRSSQPCPTRSRLATERPITSPTPTATRSR